MPKPQKYNDHLDKAGMVVSGLCAVHCSVLPIVFIVGAGSGFSWILSHEVEMIFFIVSLCIATFSLVEGYFKTHGRFDLLLFAIVGFVLLVIGHEVSGFVLSILLSTFGGLIILAAHFINFRLRSRGINFASNR